MSPINPQIPTIEGRPDISYPCDWEYTIIGENQARIEEIVGDILSAPYFLNFSHKKGRFISMHLRTRVKDEQERNSIFQALCSQKEIKLVI